MRGMMANMARRRRTRHDLIRVQGARVNNLKDVSVEIPKRRLTVFTGVSGSGKSSLVFGTIAAESQRLINETYSAFLQGFMPTMARPEVDVLEGLTTAIIVDQERMGANARSTVGTATDANAMLRVLWSRLGKPHIGPSTAYSFNVPTRKASGAMTVDKGKGERIVVRDVVYQGGMCPRCEGMGSVSDIDLSQLFDDSKSLNEGALTIPGYTADGWQVRIFAAAGLDPDKPIKKYTKKEREDFLYSEPRKVKFQNINLTYEGLVPRIKKSFLSKDVEAMQPHIRAFVERAVTFTTCPDCKGTRLNEAARSSKINKINIADACAMQISDLAEWVRDLNEPSVAPLLKTLRHTLDSFVEIGLGYLSLDRPSGTLSGGEAQRTKMIGHLGSSFTDVTYVFDEPTIGMHPHDIQRMNALAAAAARQGQHRPRGRAQAGGDRDRRSRRRPRPRRRRRRRRGGLRGHRRRAAGERHAHRATSLRPRRTQVVCAEVVGCDEGARRPHAQPEERERRHPARRAGGGDRRGWVGQELTDPRLGEWPRRSGDDRSDGDPRLAAEQPGDVHGSPRSDPQRVREGQRREARAVQRQLRGCVSDLQRRRRDLHRPRDDGRRHHGLRGVRGPAVPGVGAELQARAGRTSPRCSISRSTMRSGSSAAGQRPAHTPAAHAILQRMADVGLGYLRLGQPLTTLSGGERQRLKLATQMGDEGGVYVLDEPTSGLHLADLAQLLGLLDRLVDSGKSVIVIEHHLSVMAHADWIIDLGPGAGHDGGRIVFEGTPADLVAGKSTLTGEHLAAFVGGPPPRQS